MGEDAEMAEKKRKATAPPKPRPQKKRKSQALLSQIQDLKQAQGQQL